MRVRKPNVKYEHNSYNLVPVLNYATLRRTNLPSLWILDTGKLPFTDIANIRLCIYFEAWVCHSNVDT